MPALPLTPEQHADAARLKQLFLAWKVARKEKGEPASQDLFSDQVGFGQSAVSQYLNGKIPLNPAAAAKFSKALGCQISDFSASIAAEASEIGEAALQPSHDVTRSNNMDITELSKPEIQLVLMFRELPIAAQTELTRLASKLHGASKSAKAAAPPSPDLPLQKHKPVPAQKVPRKKHESTEY